MNATNGHITIIFDFDGTIADTVETVLRIYNRIAPEYGCRRVEHVAREMLSKARPRELMREYGMTLYKLPLVVLRMRREVNGCIAHVKPFNGIGAALYQLKSAGYALGIISSNAPENIRAFLSMNDLTGLFDFIQGSKHLFGKAAVIKRLIKKREISPRRTIYIGDETRDIEAASKAGIRVVAVSWGYQAREALVAACPDCLVDDPGELVKKIGQLHL